MAIIGGGFLATELAYSLHRRYGDHPASIRVEANRPPVEVYQIFREPGLFARCLPPALSEYCTLQTRHLGVYVMNDSTVSGARLLSDSSSSTDGKKKIVLEIKQNSGNNSRIVHKSADDGDIAKKKDNARAKDVEFDHVIVATGFRPNVELARASGLELDKVFRSFEFLNFIFHNRLLFFEKIYFLIFSRNTSFALRAETSGFFSFYTFLLCFLLLKFYL